MIPTFIDYSFKVPNVPNVSMFIENGINNFIIE